MIKKKRLEELRGKVNVKEEPKSKCSIYLPVSSEEKIQNIAEQLKASKNEIFNLAINEFLDATWEDD